jgi:hypothetical protein
MKKNKVFGIGFHKTGTTSLAEALKILGYSVTGPNGVNDNNISRNVLPMVMKLATEYDAFQDNPWPIVFREMDVAFPESKFILTIRDTDKWIESVCRHFGNDETPMRKYIYGKGAPLGNEKTYVQKFDNHNNLVVEYFKERPNDLLIMDITKGDGWDKLCGFLECDVPNAEFPHKNIATERENYKNLSLKKRDIGFVKAFRKGMRRLLRK